MMEILSHPFTSDSSSFESFDAKVTSKAIDDDVKVGCVPENKTIAMVRDEVMGVVHACAATGSSPVLVDALMKGNGKGKGKNKKGESKDPKGEDDKARVNAGRTEPRTAVTRVKTPRIVLRRKMLLPRPYWTHEG